MYFWLKLLHIAAMTVWFGGLCFLPHLFAARARGGRDGRAAFFNPVANMLFFRLMTPAALITVVLGTVLMAYGPRGAWLVMKLVVVAVAVLVHLYLGVKLYELGEGRQRHGPRFYRLLGWVPVALLLAVAALTGAKPERAGRLPPPPTAAQWHTAEGVARPAHSAGGLSPLRSRVSSSPYTPMP